MDGITRKVYVYHSMPSCSANRISASGRLVVSRAAFPLCRCRETRWSSWLVVSRSSEPLCLTRAAPSLFSCPTVTWCMPPSVSNAMGRKTSSCCRQASAVSRTFLLCAWVPVCQGSTWVCYGGRQVWGDEWVGHRNVQSGVFPIRPPTYEDITRPCSSSRQEVTLLFEAVSKIMSRSRLCLAIRSLFLAQPSAWSPMTSLGRPQAGHGPSEV